MIVILAPAYGRDYPSADAALADWNGGLDFRVLEIQPPQRGSYTSIRDFPHSDADIIIRFGRDRQGRYTGAVAVPMS
jgi:hypothetical protein